MAVGIRFANPRRLMLERIRAEERARVEDLVRGKPKPLELSLWAELAREGKTPEERAGPAFVEPRWLNLD